MVNTGVFGPEVSHDRAAYVHPTAQIYGRVSLGEGSSLWPYSVIRSEMHEVRIGRFTNIQDFVMIHVSLDGPTIVGDYCSITHHCTLHGCTIGNNVLVGIGATIMDGCVVGDNSIIAGQAFLKERTVVPPNSLVVGCPGKVIKQIDAGRANVFNALIYHANALGYAAGNHRVWTPEALAEAERRAAEIVAG